MKSIYSRKHPGSAVIGQCEWCKRDIYRSDPFVVEPENVIYKRLIHHGHYKCYENYIKHRQNGEDETPNALDKFWEHLNGK